MSKTFEVAIIGGGGAGQMAILRSTLNYLDTLAFLGDPQTKKKSRHTWVHEVENIPGMFDIRHPITRAAKDVLKFIQGRQELQKKLSTVKKSVQKIEKTKQGFHLFTDSEEYRAKNIILCTGTMDVQPKIQGSIEPIFPFANSGDILYCIRCDGHKTIGKSVAVIGHSTNTAWIAIMLKERYNNPKLWVLSNGRPFEGSMQVREILEKYKIEIVETAILSIRAGEQKKLTGFQMKDSIIPAQMAFVALGSIVYNDLAKQLGVQLNEGDHILTNEKYETNVPGFYAVGDLVAGKKKQVYTSWDMAVDAVDDIDGKIRTEKRAQRFGS